MSRLADSWVEDDAPTTWALVIGIDRYDNTEKMPLLTGAVADAVAAVRWLRLLGVPAEQIQLHAAPSDATVSALNALDVPYVSARFMDVNKSIGKLATIRGGTRLFVFLSGHGLFEPSSNRLFLLQDAGADSPHLFNLGMDEYCKLFLSWPFRRQFLFMDGCQNYPYSQAERQTISAEGPHALTGFTPDPENSLVACYAAGQSHTADEVNGRGALLNRLLPALNPDDPWLWAVELDFTTGGRTVDLRKLMHDYLIDQVQQDTASQSRQRPAVSPLGAAQSQNRWPVLALRDLPRSFVRVDVKPAEAVAAVQSLYVRVRDEPQWSLPHRRQPGQPIVTPVEAYLPKGLQVRAECNVPRSSDGWRLYRSELKFVASGDEKDLTFNLHRQRRQPPQPPPAAGRAAPPEPAAYASVQTLGPDGQPVFPLYDYTPVANQLGCAEPHTGDEVAPGVTIIRHEDGPEFTGPASASVTVAETAFAWADAVNNVTTADVSVVTEAWGASDIPLSPNVRLTMPLGGASGLAGPLASVLVMQMAPAGEPPDTASAQWHSLDELETAGQLRVEPGPTRVTLTLPWGTWTRTVYVPPIGSVTLDLPATVGTPPLRVPLAAELGRSGQHVLGLSGPLPLGWAGPAPGSTPITLQAAPTTTAAWALAIPGDLAVDDQAAYCTLRASPALTFPLQPGRTFGVDLPNRRVEPLSAVPVPEWDLLVGAGLIDAVGPERAVELIREPDTDPLLRLAAGYVLWSAGELEMLQRSGFQDPAGPATVDHAVLTLAMLDRIPDPSSSPEHASEPPYLAPATILEWLKDWAKRQEIPLFRWGLGLTLNLDPPKHQRLNRICAVQQAN